MAVTGQDPELLVRKVVQPGVVAVVFKIVVESGAITLTCSIEAPPAR
jgi:hypothetical protein